VKAVTATYGGDANYHGSTSAPVNQSVGDFTIAVSPTSRTVNGNQKATFTLTMTPVNGITGNVALSCSGAAGSCTVSPSSVTLSGTGAQTATATVSTSNTNKGTFTMTFTGNYNYSTGVLTHSTTASLTVK
jgi:hypothetical protein